MTKSALAAALLALIGTALVATPAAAADLPAILRASVSIPEEVGADEIGQLQAVTVTDLAPDAESVRVTLAGTALAPLDAVEDPEGVVTATGTIDTWGFAGNNRSLVLAQCVDEAATDCGDPLTITTRIDNPVPTHDLNPPGTEFSDDFDVTTHLAVTTGLPRLRLTTDGQAPVFVDPEAVLPVDTDALTEGAHQVAVAVCAADEAPCVAVPPVAFDVVRSVAGSFSLSASVFSPNDDGKFDTVNINYTQVDVWDSASVEVRNAADEVVFSSAVPLPVAPSTNGTFLYDGKDSLGVVLPDGSYTARLSVSRTLDSGDTASSTYAPKSFTVDTTAQAPPTLTATPGTFYPYVDGYRDTTKLSYTGQEPYSRVDLFVRNAANATVRAKQILVPADASWNGRNNVGSRVPAGVYNVFVRVIDSVGNLSYSPTASVTVSDKKLLTITRAVTVTPKASIVTGVTGACSTRRTPSLHGWAGSTGYLSNTRCRTTFAASRVWTHNQVHLPSAVTYHWVRLGWYGGPTKAATRDRAIATLYGTDNTAQGWFSSVDYMAAQYIPSVKGSRVVKAGDVSWGFQTDRGNRYDVKSFTITYRADVLR